jgi:23S rRNA (guanine2445-N2)-methyltransferase / 23S rRNA (guanine2069-N7)-methyltransferase
MRKYEFFATTPKGLELLLVDELHSLGATDAAEKLAGVIFSGDIKLAYKACLWSRLANRILLKLTDVSAATPEALYSGVQTIQWDQHIHSDNTFAVQFVSSKSEMTHTLYGAQKAKDAIVDQLRDQHGRRPDVSREQPDVSVFVYVRKDRATIYLDLSGESLHKRGYRLSAGEAPLKENLAAAILIRAGWPAIAKEGGALFDPMCGSGTLLIEAAMMATNMAPGLLRDYFGFIGWQQHDADCWDALLEEAHDAYESCQLSPMVVGYDQDGDVIKTAFENIERAGFRGLIHVEKRELSDFAPLSKATPGLIITNPPYGERLGEAEELQALYTLLGDRLKETCVGWKAAVLTGNPDLGKQMGLRAKKFYSLFNGSIPCKLLLFDVESTYFIDRSYLTRNENS